MDSAFFSATFREIRMLCRAKGILLTTVMFSLTLISRTNQTASTIVTDYTKSANLIYKGSLDTCLCAVSAHENRRTSQTECITLTSSSSSSNSEGELQVSLIDSLGKALLKISVQMFTKYYELKFLKLTKHGIPYCFRIVSHYKALYYYREGEYGKLLNTCDSIISCSKTPPGCPHQFFHSVSVQFGFELFFGNDVTCLTGIIALIYRNLLDEKHSTEKRTTFKRTARHERCAFFNENVKELTILISQPTCAIISVSCLFLVYYLRFQSMIRLGHPKSAILSAMNDLKHASIGFAFEDILLLFVGMTWKRLH